MLIRKHIGIGQQRTTLALEPPFWTVIEALAGDNGARAWTEAQLQHRPDTIGQASWIRQQVLGEVVKKTDFA